MAKSKRSSSQRQGGGSTLYGVLAGLLIGLIVAAAVAFYVTRAPMPFVDRATREPARQPMPDPRNAPDPNSALYGRDGPAGTPSSGPTASAPAPLPGITPAQPPAQPPGDALGDLIATLPPMDGPAAPPSPRDRPAAPAPAAPAAAPAQPGAPGATYYLQVGAYRGQQDAEALRARILLLGMPVEIQRAEVNGQQINRVRVGPFARLDDMNRSRARLGQENIVSTVVRQ